MCISHYYEQVLPDGRTDRWAEDELCPKSRYNKPCDYTQVLQHPTEHLHPGQLSPSFGRMQFPPTPPLSAHSASTSDSERSSKRRSRTYTNEQKILEINNSKRSPRREKDDRAAYGDKTPISRTPPRQYILPDSVSTSPDRESYHSRESRRRESIASERERPTTANSRPTTIKIEVADDRPQKTHRRSDASSRTSKTSSRDGSDDGEHRRRRQSVAITESEQEQQRKQRLESEIARANAAIANRPVLSSTPAVAPVSVPTQVAAPARVAAPAPAPNAVVPASSAPVVAAPNSRYRRGSVVVDPLTTKMDQLQIDVQKERRRREKIKQANEERAARDEEEAQKRRLMERMAPKPRRATVGAAQKRHKVQYDDGLYRFE